MKLTIHRGTHEIGGTCIELQSKNSRILIDFGMPLVDENRKQFNSSRITNKTEEELIKTGILHPIEGIYKHEKPKLEFLDWSSMHVPPIS